MGVELFYFSGTGNSIHVARELQRRIPNTTLKPIISALNKDQPKSVSDIVGFIFPIHAHTYPWVVEKFLRKIDLQSASYVFAISNRECADKVFLEMNEIFKKKKFTLNASFMVNTPENFVPVFKVPTEEEIIELESKMLEKLDKIQRLIINNIPFHEKTGPIVNVFANTLLRLSNFIFTRTRYLNLQKSFIADDKCTGCGICEKICLSEQIKIIDKKPTWDLSIPCTYCFACISYCPTQAIQAWRTKKKGRYHHPLIKAKDIAEQNI